LAELLHISQRQVIARKKQQAVQQRAGVTSRKYETIAIGPGGILRVVSKMTGPQDISHRRGAHRRPRVPGLRVLNRIDG
jgi:hypothetical protein